MLNEKAAHKLPRCMCVHTYRTYIHIHRVKRTYTNNANHSVSIVKLELTLLFFPYSKSYECDGYFYTKISTYDWFTEGKTVHRIWKMKLMIITSRYFLLLQESHLIKGK